MSGGQWTVNRGFTFLEMVVVLMILAIVTHLAVRELGHVKKDALRSAATAQLVSIGEAVLGSGDDRDALGARTRAGFLADMGRLPKLVSTNGVLTLDELWVRPAGVEAYAVRAAVSSNFVSGVSSGDADEDVYVPCGWKGPYVKLDKASNGRLRDAWGNLMELPDETGGCTRLLTVTNATTFTEGETISGIRHLGADGVLDSLKEPESPGDVDDAVLFDTATNATLTVYLTFTDSDGETQTPSVATVRVYGPYEDKINVWSADGTGVVTVEGLTPGPRVYRVEYLATKLGVPRLITLQPGANVVSEKFQVTTGSSEEVDSGQETAGSE